MRILQVNTSDRGGGAENVAWALHDYFRSRGHDCALAVGRKRSDDPATFEVPNREARGAWFQSLSSLSSRLRDGRTPSKGILRRKAAGLAKAVADPLAYIERKAGWEDFHHPGTWRLPRVLSWAPDVVHCHNLHGDYFDLRALTWLSLFFPVVLTLHDSWLLAGHCAHPMECERWVTGCGRCPRLDIPIPLQRDGTAANWRRKRGIYRASRLYVTAPSAWMMDRAARSMLNGLEPKVIPNSVDLELFSPGDRRQARARLGLPMDEPLALFAGNDLVLNPWKDFQTAVRAMGLVNRHGEGRTALLVALGAGGRAQAPLSPDVLPVPFTEDRARIADFFRAADVYLHAARAEVFGLTILEAMASGLPVVATGTGGVPEVVENGVTGFLVPPGDAQALAKATSRLLFNGELAGRMGAAGRARALREYPLSRQGGEYLAYYSKVIADWLDHASSKGERR